ncbi:formylglycine-generating enzyme family protein [Halanaerobacter jeridensis]|uniref:Formylglycine-generating enzyme required for sulfatase activity n=1 Tax=Halanaerobacter jeridensis TaxID=706427 RepID=A0A938XUH9_9FIRM|nr:SUMF1/EgtB/PvdO family nonheme iron enzyme [Halanaerobacter jeridensis]MBM7557755.1 formylglycine-generating enzyme required for sulfatase activity [Halanaerobacter jeridensis]
MKKKRITILVLSLILLLGLVGCSDDDSVKKYNLTVEPKTDGTGEVTVEPLKDKYEEGKEVTLTPNGKGEHNFDHWEGSGYDGNTDNPLILEMTSDITLVAVFKDSIAPSSPTIEGISAGKYNSNQTFTISGVNEAKIEYSTDGGTSWTEYSSEVTLSEEKTYDLVARQTDEAGNTSSNTATITVTIDKTAPDWTTGPNITTTADTSSVGISAQVDEGGTVYYKVIFDGITKLTASEVKSAGNSTSISADIEKEITIDSLNAGTKYDIFFVAEDNAGNLQSDSIVKKVDVSTTITAPEMVTVLSGTAADGSTSIDYDIEMGKYEITHAEFIKFLNSAGVTSDGSYEGKEIIDMDAIDCAVGYDDRFYFAGSGKAKVENTPVIEVTWYGAVAYYNWLSEHEGLTPAYDLNNWELKTSDKSVLEGYRLPTANEWWYAARGGADGDNTTYAGSDNIDEVAWYGEDWNIGSTHPVGELKANELGIYDISGNVWEWSNTPYGSSRVVLGGSWGSDAVSCEVDNFYASDPSFGDFYRGFRLTKTK